MNPILQAALGYAQRGWKVFPLHGKHPLPGTRGVLDATTDEQQLRQWFERYPNRGIGLACGKPSGVWALDFDNDAARQRFILEHGKLPPTLVSKTARGLHLLFAMPADGDVKNSAKDGVDVRGTGGYIVLPPSRHPSGQSYTWLNLVPPSPAPDWLLQLVRNRRPDKAEPLPNMIYEGERESALVSLAGSMRNRGASVDAILAAISAENDARCTPPLEDKDLKRIANSVGRYEPAPDAPLAQVDAVDEFKAVPRKRWFVPPEDLRKIERPDERWFVTGHIPVGGTAILAGYPKTNKTMFALDLAVAVATGTPFLGNLPVPEQRRVGLVLMEDLPYEIRSRVDRLLLARDLECDALGDRLHVAFRPDLKLAKRDTVQELGAQARDLGLDLLVVDSWSYVATGNENASESVRPQLQNLSDIAEGLTVMLTHHAPKKSENRGQRVTDYIRGSSHFGAWYTTGIILDRINGTGPIAVQTELRNYPAPEEYAFTVEDETNENGVPGGALWLRVSDYRPTTLKLDHEATSIKTLVHDVVQQEPGASSTAIAEAAGKRKMTVLRALKMLEEEGLVTSTSQGKAKFWTAITGAEFT